MEKLLEYVRKLEAAELKRSCRAYEDFFPSNAEGLVITGEEFDETGLEISIARRYMMLLERGEVTRGYLEEMENRMLNAACEAIQTAAMCKKWKLSLERMEANGR